MTQADELPRRPRRKLVTPLTASLTAVLLTALGFLGGVQVQKSAADPAPTGAAAAGFTRARGFTPQGAAGASGATVGTVANVDGHTLYVKDSSGNTIRVKTNRNSKVTRTAVSKATEVHPGDTVIVQGIKSNGGTVTANSVAATARNATGGFAGALGAGGGPPAQRGSGG